MNDIFNKITPLYFYNTFVLPIYFDDDLDSYQKLLKIQYKINEIIKNQTSIIEWLNQLKEWIDTQLELYAKNQLNEWLTDGTLEKLINMVLFNTKIGKYTNVADMVADESLTDGNVVKTLGFYEPNDLGGALYLIVTEETPNGMDMLELKNGLVAKLIIDREININMFGAQPTNPKNHVIIQRAIDYCSTTTNKLSIPPQTYNVYSYNDTVNKAIFTISTVGLKLEGSSFGVSKIQAQTDSIITNYGILLINTANSITLSGFEFACAGVVNVGIGTLDTEVENYVSYSTFTNLRVSRAIEEGYRIAGILSSINQCFAYNCKVGIRICGTSLKISGCYTNGTQANGFQTGYFYDNLRYCTLTDNACDGAKLMINANRVWGVSVLNQGGENCSKVMEATQFDGFNLEGFRLLRCGETTHELITFTNGYNVTIKGMSMSKRIGSNLYDVQIRVNDNTTNTKIFVLDQSLQDNNQIIYSSNMGNTQYYTPLLNTNVYPADRTVSTTLENLASNIQLSPKLTSYMTTYTFSNNGTLTDSLVIQYFYGSGAIRIYGKNNTVHLKQPIKIISCGVPVCFSNINFILDSDFVGNFMFETRECNKLAFYSCSADNKTTTSMYISKAYCSAINFKHLSTTGTWNTTKINDLGFNDTLT
jgi:hypothetical protein